MICSPLPASIDISKHPHLNDLELADEYQTERSE